MKFSTKLRKPSIRELQSVLEEYRASDADKDNRILRKLQEDSYQSVIDELHSDLVEYEELRRGKLLRFECGSLIELPQTLIKARIARGLSHKELAELCGMTVRQIQHYEETDYEGAALWKVMEVATVLSIEVWAIVTLKEFERIPSLEELTQLEPLMNDSKSVVSEKAKARAVSSLHNAGYNHVRTVPGGKARV